jgi:chromate transporter
MHRILVDERRWVSERRFLHALNYCMLLPGPEAQQLATYVGWLLHGVRGGLTAGLLFVLPGFVSILALSLVYAQHSEVGFVAALFYGLKPAVAAIVLASLVRIGKRALRSPALVLFAAAAFVAIFFLDVRFPLVVLGAGVLGWLLGSVRPEALAPPSGAEDADDALVASEGKPRLARTLATALAWLAVWLLPVLALWLVLGRGHVLVQEGVFFSKVAVVTFGGAYAVLTYVAQRAVDDFGWLAPGEMLDGLGLAETTPGPLIQVVQFVGFLAAYRAPGALSPVAAGVAGSLVTAWVTFAPSFLWIFTGAPYIEALRDNRTLGNALSGIRAAVVGVIANLAAWFALHVLFARVETVHRGGLRLFAPDWSTLDAASLALTIAAGVALIRYRVGMFPTLLGCAALGASWHLATR